MSYVAHTPAPHLALQSHRHRHRHRRQQQQQQSSQGFFLVAGSSALELRPGGTVAASLDWATKGAGAAAGVAAHSSAPD